jgi:methylglutaconyl-CoA hydratase
MYQTISVEQAGAVATIWLDRPAVHNAFDETLIGELDAAVGALDADAQVRVVVLAGRGRNFCAGADLNWMARAAAAGDEENLQDARRFAGMLRRLCGASKPTIARVQGAALGGGLGLAAACDICVAAEDASFAMSEVRLGLIPAVIGPLVVRAIGLRASLRYMQTAERIGATRALELGLVHEVVAAEGLDAAVARIATALLAGGPASQAAAKALLRVIAAADPADDLVEATAQAIAAQRRSDEAREGIGAFLAKRPPRWTPAE